MQQFILNIKYLLKVNNLKQIDLTELDNCTISQSTITTILKGKYEPRVGFLIAISKKFNIGVNELLYSDIENMGSNKEFDTIEKCLTEIDRLKIIVEDYQKQQVHIKEFFSKNYNK